MDCDPLDPQYVADVLSRPPFVTISGVHNVRDIAALGSHLKPNFVFRGAEVSSITEEGECYTFIYARTIILITPIMLFRQSSIACAWHHHRVRFAIGHRNREIQ